LEVKADLLMLQEVRCGTAELQELAKRANCQVVYGDEVDGMVLVAAFAWVGALTKISKCPTGASHHFRWNVGGQAIHVRNAYFQSSVAQEREAAERSLEDWLEEAEVSGEPALVVGDFNATRDEVAATRWYDAVGWYELGGAKQPATCLPSKGRPRRIDWMLANRALQPAVRGDVQVRWDLGLKPHAVQMVDFELQETRVYAKWMPPTPLAPTGAGAAGPSPEAKESRAKHCRLMEQLGAQLWAGRQQQWAAAMASGSVEEAWSVFWQATLELHHNASGGQQAEWLPGFIKMQKEMQPRKGGKVVDRVGSLLIRRQGQLETLHRVCNLAGAERATIRRQLVKKLRKDCGCPQLPPIAADLSDPLVIKGLIKATCVALEQHKNSAAIVRRDKWHQWLAEQKEAGNKEVFAWIRKEDASWAPSGQGKQQQLEAADAAWWGLWGKKMLPAAVVEAVGKTPQGVAMPRMAPISGQRLRQTVKTMGRKAGGADGLKADDWQSWPSVHWERLAQLLQMCEQQGTWPEQLLHAHVVLLSKAGKPVDGLQARPITILPLIYRAWAKIRARQLKVWLEEHTTLLVGNRQEAEYQAAVLATTLALGKATGEEAGAVCVDFAKAYDTLDLDYLEQARRKAGVSQQILGPAFAMYRAKRAVRIGDACAVARTPFSGLPAGCPFATFFLALVTQEWRFLRDLQSAPSVRTWVDDCTAFVQGKQAAVELAAEGRWRAERMQDMSLVVNKAKSGVLGTSAELTKAMREAAGPLFACTEALKDLGVVQGTGVAERKAAMARWSTACGRLTKIAKLSVPMAEKCHFAAASALAAGVFGTSCREQPDYVVDAMRRWVRHAVWHGGPAADYRILLWTGVVPARADPVTAVLLAAARTVSLLVQDGHFSINQLEWLWLAGDSCNPVAALRKALQRAGVAGDLRCWRSGGSVLEQPLAAYERVRNDWLREAQRRQDMGNVVAGRPKFKLVGQPVRWEGILAQLGRLKLTADRRAALIGVMAGDAVSERMAARWNKGPGLCACGAPEDLTHRWWHCPRRQLLRMRALQGAKAGALAALPACTREFGIPTELPEIQAWHAALPQDRWEDIPASRKYYSDGSCLHPRTPEISVAAWAVVGCTGGVWWIRAGPCPGAQTIGRAELAAVCHILVSAVPGVIFTDCRGVYTKCIRIIEGLITKQELLRGANADLWGRCWGPLRSQAGWQFAWLPSHRTEAEAVAAGIEAEDWRGNAMADAAAKAKAREADLSPDLRSRWADQQAAIQAVWRLIAESQVAHLASRPRRLDGAAVKSRKRRAPRQPWRVRGEAAAGRRRKGPAAAAASQPGRPERAMAGFQWPELEAVPGVHDLRPEMGPIGVRGWPKNAGGSLAWRWKCACCGKTADNTSRLFEVLRKPCGQPDEGAGQWRKMPHEVALVNGKVRCNRCGTERDNHVQLGRQGCPVQVLYRSGAPVREATAVYAAWHRCVRVMHAMSSTGGAAVQEAPAAVTTGAPAPVPPQGLPAPPQARPGAVLRQFRSHAVVKAGTTEFCMLCFVKAPRYKVAEWRSGCCDGAAPVAGCPKHVLMAAVVSAVDWPAKYAERGAAIQAAGEAWQEGKAGLALQPPRCRRAAGGGPAGLLPCPPVPAAGAALVQPCRRGAGEEAAGSAGSAGFEHPGAEGRHLARRGPDGAVVSVAARVPVCPAAGAAAGVFPSRRGCRGGGRV